MRRTLLSFAALSALIACAETKQDGASAPVAAAPAEVSWEAETWKDAPPAACSSDADGGAPAEEAAPSDAGAPGSSEPVVAAIRAHVRPCYDELLSKDPGAHGRIVLQVWTKGGGAVCGVRPSLRVGLPLSVASCVERMLKDAKFEGVPSPLTVPLTYTMKRPDGSTYGHPSRVELGACAAKLGAPTDATITYATDATGQVGDLAVEPWHGDQAALECAADALKKSPHGASTQYVLRLRLHP